MCLQITRTITHDNKHSQAASFTKARTHACVLARQLQDSQGDIKELLTEVADWQKVASETTAQLQQRDLQVSVEQCSCTQLVQTMTKNLLALLLLHV